MSQEHDRLAELLRQQVQAASKKALDTDGQVAPEEIARLNGLARLAELSKSAGVRPGRARWLLAGVLAGTLLLASVLLFLRVPETEVELDITADQVSFALPADQVLTDVIIVSAIGASGIAGVQLPAEVSGSDDGDATDAVGSLHLGTLDGGSGTLTLASLAVAAGTRVNVRQTGVPQQYRLTLHGGRQTLRIDAKGEMRLAIGGRPPEERRFDTPRPVIVESDSGDLDIDFTLPNEGRAAFMPQLRASELAFVRIDEHRTESQTLLRRLSTILSGTVHFTALNDMTYSLRAGEPLRFARADGVIRALELRDERVVFSFQGRVRGMRTGWGDGDRSLMPTYLAWLKARHGLSLLWGTALYLFGLIAGLLRWWGVRL